MNRRQFLRMILLAAASCWTLGVVAQELKEDVPQQSTDELAKWLDDRFAKIYSEAGLTPSANVDDGTFMRRAYLDLVGSIPRVSEARDFFDDTAPYKRTKLIEDLIDDRRSAEHLARVWRKVLVPRNSPGAMMATRLEPWLEQQFSSNVSYDTFARALITAKPNPDSNLNQAAVNATPLVFYQAVGNTPDNLANAFTRVFLGVRIGCAKCHDHPFASWKKDNFWGMAAFFAGANTRGGPNMAVSESKLAKITPMDGSVEYTAQFLWSESATSIPDDKFPREVLADWLTSADNPNFAATAVNRFWQHLCGRGLVDSVDDLDQVPAAERAIVLDDLAKKFSDNGFDTRWLIEGICKSRAYQLATLSARDRNDVNFLTHRPLKTLTAEQVFDSIEQALSLPVSKNDRSPRYNGQRLQMIARLSEASAKRPDEFQAGIPQALMMMNGILTAAGTGLDDSRTLRGVVDAPFLKRSAKIETLYLAAFTRRPRAKELKFLTDYIDRQPNKEKRRQAYADIYWGLLNSPEFVLSR